MGRISGSSPKGMDHRPNQRPRCACLYAQLHWRIIWSTYPPLFKAEHKLARQTKSFVLLMLPPESVQVYSLYLLSKEEAVLVSIVEEDVTFASISEFYQSIASVLQAGFDFHLLWSSSHRSNGGATLRRQEN